MSLLFKEMTLDTKAQGVNCTASVMVNSINGLGVNLSYKDNPNLYGFKIDLPNLYFHTANNDLYKRFNGILVGETDTEYIVVKNFIEAPYIFSTPKEEFSFTKIEEITLSSDINDYFIYLEDIGEEYTVNIEIGNSYDYKNMSGQRKFTFNTRFSKSNKVFGVMNAMKNFNYAEFVFLNYVVKEDIGMKIDTTLDKEPIYFCDGTKDRLLITEDMIVRGNTNFANDEITINDKRIICEDNLKG